MTHARGAGATGAASGDPGPMGDARPVVVLGAGVAGMVAALSVAPWPCVLVSPEAPGRGGSTELAQGGLAAAVGAGDRPADHAADTLAAGAGLCDAATVDRIVGAGPEVVALLADLGVAWDRAAGEEVEGREPAADPAPWALGREGGHGRHRVVHAGDRSGAVIAAALADAVAAAGHVTHLAGEATGLLTGEDRVTDVRVRTATGERDLAAAAVVLATGGFAGLFRDSTNPATNAGAGIVLAARAGAVLGDLEFVQFHPTALDLADTPVGRSETAAGRPPAERLPLLTEALRGDGAVLRADGQRFVGEVAPRDVVAAAVHAQRLAGRRVELDCRGVRGLEEFTALAATAAAVGLDPRRDPLPVCPAAHYTVGGVLSDARGRTTVPGLWAVGEVACTGLHGANRLASNSLLEGVVTARAAAADVLSAAGEPAESAAQSADLAGTWHDGWRSPVGAERTITADAAEAALATERLLGDGPARDPLVGELLSTAAGVARRRDEVHRALTALEGRPGPDALVARLVLRSALRRERSVGGHRWVEEQGQPTRTVQPASTDQPTGSSQPTHRAGAVA